MDENKKNTNEEIFDFDDLLETKSEKKEAKKEVEGKIASVVKPDVAEKKNDVTKEKEEVKDDVKKEASDEIVKKIEEKIDAVKKDDTKDNDNKESVKSAITQGKRLADAKAAQKEAGEVVIAKTEKKSKSSKGIWISLASVLGVLLVAYIAGFVYFSGHFYKDVAVNGIDVSNMNKATAKNTVDAFYKHYVLTLETIDGKTIPIDGSSISMQISLRDDMNEAIKKQKAYLWFINMFTHHDIEMAANATWDDAALAKICDKMSVLKKENMTAPVDAYIGVEDGKLTIVNEVLGTTLNESAFKQAVNNGLSMVVSKVSLLDAGCYVLPKVYADDENLKKEYEAKKDVVKNTIKLQLDDLTLDVGMDIYNAVLEKNGDTYVVSEKLVKEYVKSLADEYDTLGKDRIFKTSFDGKEVVMKGEIGTAFGYEMNQEETAKALYQALQGDSAVTVNAVFNKKGYTLQGDNDIGDTYIEVNLSEQKIIGYKNGKKITEGDCVSGNESAGHGTCIGLYAIQDKKSPTVLRGEKKEVVKTVTKKKNGKKVKVQKKTMEYEYESPVTFWMPFSGGIGLHDAVQWRSSYGGNIYLYNGSHGCVNLTYGVAEALYNNFSVGDPVIVYFWDNENRK